MNSLQLGKYTKLIVQSGCYTLQHIEDELHYIDTRGKVYPVDYAISYWALRQKACYEKTGKPIDPKYQQELDHSHIWRVVHTAHVSKEMLLNGIAQFAPSELPKAVLSDEYKNVHIHVTYNDLATGLMVGTISYNKLMGFSRRAGWPNVCAIDCEYCTINGVSVDRTVMGFTLKQSYRVLDFIERNSGSIM